MAKLKVHTTVAGVTYGPGDEVSREVAEAITNPDVWESAPAATTSSVPAGADDSAESGKSRTSGGQRR